MAKARGRARTTPRLSGAGGDIRRETGNLLMKQYGYGLAALVLLAGPACAADLPASAVPPPSGSPLYSPTSMVTGDISLGVGWTGTNGNVDKNSATGHVAGRTNFGLWPGWNEELEATGVWNFNDGRFDG